MRKQLINYLAMTFIIFGAIVAIVGITHRAHQVEAQAGTMTTPPFTMQSTQTSYNIGGDGPYLNATRVRYQKSDGSWKESATYYNRDGSARSSTTTLGITGLGVFEINNNSKTLTFLGPKKHSMHVEDEKSLRSDPEYVRDDLVLGFKVMVQHSLSGSDFDDVYRAPELGGAIVKIVSGSVTGKGYTVIEPKTIERGEPSESFAVPDYPFVYSFYEAQIEKEDNRGNKDVAAKMRQVIVQHKARAHSVGVR
jgi:hypothetical protein